nr:reverse transcriptase domain-containing protein [Tanacetum cinerariifolium]
ETVHEERGDKVERTATTASSLEAEHDSETQRRYGHDTEINIASTSITTASINITTAEPLTIASAPVTNTGVSVSTAEPSTPPTTTTVIEDEDLTIAQTLMKMRSVKSKEKSKEKGVYSTRLTRGVIMKEASETTSRPIVPPQQQLDPKDKVKGIMQEPKKPVKGNDQIELDEEVAQRLEAQMQAEFKEEERILQAEEQGELTINERLKLFVELIDKREKHFAKLRAEEIRRKPPTKAQKRNQKCTYLKSMANYKHSQLKNKSFKEIQMLFDNTMKWINSFVPMDSEVLEGSGKKAESSGKEAVSKKRTKEEFDQESSKRQKTSWNSIHSFDDMMRKFLSKYFPPSMVTKLRNEITKFEQKPHESLFKAWERYKLSIDWHPNHNMLLVTQIDMFFNEGTGGEASRGSGRTRVILAIRVIVKLVVKGMTKEFLAYKEYDGKGGVVVYTCWIKKMESIQDMSGYRSNQKVKYTASSFVSKALTWWNYEIHTLGQEVAVGMSCDDFKVLMREEFYPSNDMKKLETEL